MKQLFLFFLLIPTFLYAQEDPKYGLGMVPVVKGKVTFTEEVNLPGRPRNKSLQKH